MITQEYLKLLFNYNPLTGEFTRKVQVGSTGYVNKTIDCLNHNGYYRVCIDYKSYLVSRLIFLYMEGYMPKVVEHKDRDRTNNRWENLRPATQSQNGFNRLKNKNNTSGFKGVSYCKGRDKWLAKFNYQGKSKSKYLNTKEEAIEYIKLIRPLFHKEFNCNDHND